MPTSTNTASTRQPPTRRAVRRWSRSLPGAAALLLAVAGAAPAATVYTNRSAWEAAQPDIVVIDFEGIAPAAGQVDYGTAAGLTLSGVNFVGHRVFSGRVPFQGYALTVSDAAFAPTRTDWGSGAVLDGIIAGLTSFAPPASTSGWFDVTLPTGTHAFGTDLMAAGGIGDHALFHTVLPASNFFKVTLAGGESVFVDTGDHPSRSFIGFISSTPIASVRIELGSHLGLAYHTETGALDNVAYSATPVPEPGTWALLGLGLIGGTWRRNTIRSRPSAPASGSSCCTPAALRRRETRPAPRP